MKEAVVMVAAVVCLAAAVLTGLCFRQPAQRPAYQAAVWGEVVVVCETGSGRCWVFSPMQRVWVALSGPLTD